MSEKNIEPKLTLISDYLRLQKNESEHFVIPEYQREYSWKDKVQCEKLWQDVMDYLNADASEPYFFGTVILDCSTENEIRLIDGQQRTTTFLLLFKALQIRLSEVLMNEVLKNSFDDDSQRLKAGLEGSRNAILSILYKADDEKIFDILKDWNNAKNILIIENKSINEIDEYKSDVQKILVAKDFYEAECYVYKIPRRQKDNKYTNYFCNFKFFYEKLKLFSQTDLNFFAKGILKNCQIIEIRSWNFDQAITMFNSLNSTGMPLSDANIISSELYSNAKDKDEFNKLWKEIIDNANRLETEKILSIDSVLQQFMYIERANDKKSENLANESYTTVPGVRRFYKEIKKGLLSEPLVLCGKFKKIIGIWEAAKDFSVVKLLLKFNENAKLFFISYLYKFELDEISENVAKEIAENLIRLFAIYEISSTSYSSKNFKSFLFDESLKLIDKNYSVSQIKMDFANHIANTWKKDDVKNEIKEYRGNVLVFLNEYLFAKENEKQFNFDRSVNIEHIMPQSGQNIISIREDANLSEDDFKDAVNKLGNKILLEEKINKTIGNEWFQTKIQQTQESALGYKDSKYNIALSLLDYPSKKWKKEDIEKATEKASNRIAEFIFE